jgi:hypothetical protein
VMGALNLLSRNGAKDRSVYRVQNEPTRNPHDGICQVIAKHATSGHRHECDLHRNPENQPQINPRSQF